VLDIACGTGIVARVAEERLGGAGYFVGIDLSPEMLAVARAVAPGIDWREGNASSLPLREREQFDVVVCRQGLQFFSDKPAAAAYPSGEGRGELIRWLVRPVSSWRDEP